MTVSNIIPNSPVNMKSNFNCKGPLPVFISNNDLSFTKILLGANISPPVVEFAVLFVFFLPSTPFSSGVS